MPTMSSGVKLLRVRIYGPRDKKERRKGSLVLYVN